MAVAWHQSAGRDLAPPGRRAQGHARPPPPSGLGASGGGLGGGVDRATGFFRPPCVRAHCLEREGAAAASAAAGGGDLSGAGGAWPRWGCTPGGTRLAAGRALPRRGGCPAGRGVRAGSHWPAGRAPDPPSCVPGAGEWPGTSAPAPPREPPHSASQPATVVVDPPRPSSSPLRSPYRPPLGILSTSVVDAHRSPPLCPPRSLPAHHGVCGGYDRGAARRAAAVGAVVGLCAANEHGRRRCFVPPRVLHGRLCCPDVARVPGMVDRSMLSPGALVAIGPWVCGVDEGDVTSERVGHVVCPMWCCSCAGCIVGPWGNHLTFPCALLICFSLSRWMMRCCCVNRRSRRCCR